MSGGSFVERSFASQLRRRVEPAEDHPRSAPPVRRATLKVGSANDPTEAEADRMADAVIATLSSGDVPGGRLWPSDTRIRRSTAVGAAPSSAGAVCPDVDRVTADLAAAVRLDGGLAISRSATPEPMGPQGGPLDAGIESRIRRSRSGGEPLPDSVRRPMETSFGADFGRVRLHTGAPADELNQSLASRAFTVGGDVFFARGQYQPGSDAGRALLAHELTHTIQQGGANRSPSIQRALVDVDGLVGRFDRDLTSSSDTRASQPARAALRDYNAFLATRLRAPKWKAAAPHRGGGGPALGGHRGADGATGTAFFGRIQTLLTALSRAIGTLIEQQTKKKADASWLVSLIEQDIPHTLGWAANVRDEYPKYAGMTGLEALREARTKPLTDYLASQFPRAGDWAQLPDEAKQLLLQNRDSDAARVAAIRDTAKQMMAQKKSPRKILAFMADGATEFVQTVVFDYVHTMGLGDQALALVSTGSFGSGELFPYSDVDVQLMKAGLGNDAAEIARMQLILDNIRLRVRLASMKEFGGKWENTLGWDLDQLAQDRFDAVSAAAGDPYRGLAFTNLVIATGGGEAEAATLQQLEQNNLAQNGIDLLENELWMRVRPGTGKRDWRVPSPADLDIGAGSLDFKEKFMRFPKVYLNALAMFYGLRSDNSWARIDELVKRKTFSKKVGEQFKSYLDLTAMVRLRYQFFYEKEGKDDLSPTPGLPPFRPAEYPKGYYELTPDDRKSLKKAQLIQEVLALEVQKTRIEMQNATAAA